MKIIADLHTHTNVSHHAFSSLEEMCAGAKRAGHIAIAITNHAPSMEDGAHKWHFGNYRIMPKTINGVFLIPGIEYDILDGGQIYDLGEKYRQSLKFSIASFHEETHKTGDIVENTKSLDNILRNPIVDCLGHLGNANFPFDMEHIISQCNKYDKIVEINNNSFSARRGSDKNCIEIAKLCKKYNVNIVLTSDSHVSFTIGNVDTSKGVIEEVDFPRELILNTDTNRLRAYFLRKHDIDILTK